MFPTITAARLANFFLIYNYVLMLLYDELGQQMRNYGGGEGEASPALF